MILALIPGIGEPELYAVCAAVVTAVVSWIVYAVKMKRRCAEFSATLTKQQTGAAAALAATEKMAANQLEDAQKSLKETALKLADVEQRFATHRQVADRRQTDASLQITRLEADVAAARETAAQLVPTQERIKDLERALLAEQGRVQAQEQTIQATNARAADFEKRLGDAQELVIKHKGEMQAVAVELKKVRDEQSAYLAAGGVEAELAKAREAQQQAEARNANLQRALKVAETRVEMVQKEFMNAVGMASAPVGGALASSASSDKKVRELEEKVIQMESEARKRAREDGYKIAELEYRLSEALESTGTPGLAPASAPAPVLAPAPPPEPAPEPEHEPEAVAPSSAEAVIAAPVPEPAPAMPAALAPAVVEIPPMDAAEESVPAQPSATPPETAVSAPDAATVTLAGLDEVTTEPPLFVFAEPPSPEAEPSTSPILPIPPIEPQPPTSAVSTEKAAADAE